MALLTLLPLGTLQLLAAIEHGYWYARSAEFMQQPIVELLVWMRVPGRHDLQHRRGGAHVVRVPAVGAPRRDQALPQGAQATER